MEFIQRKTADRAVSHFLLKAADQEITLTWIVLRVNFPNAVSVNPA